MIQTNTYLPVVAGELSWDRKTMIITSKVSSRFTITGKLTMKPTEKTFEYFAFQTAAVAAGLFLGEIGLAPDAAEQVGRSFYDVEMLDANTAFVARPILPVWMVEGKDK